MKKTFFTEAAYFMGMIQMGRARIISESGLTIPVENSIITKVWHKMRQIARMDDMNASALI